MDAIALGFEVQTVSSPFVVYDCNGEDVAVTMGKRRWLF
jgi:hypothetical protein